MNDSDFRQFNGSFDSAIEPDRAFSDRLQQRMKAERPLAPASVRPTVVASAPARVDRAPAPPRRSHPLYIAAAVLVVFALAAASIVQLAPRVLDPQYASQSVATLPANVSTTPGPDVPLTAEELPGIGGANYYHVDGENLIATTVTRETDTRGMVSYDLRSNEVRWETHWQSQRSEMTDFIFSEDVIVGLSYTYSDSPDENEMPKLKEMMAYSADTGEELWRNSIADWQVEFGWETIFMMGDSVIFRGAGALVSINANTGGTRWQVSYDLYMPQEDYFIQPPALVERGGYLYLGQVDGTVEVFDMASGASVTTFSLPASFREAHPVGLRMITVPDGLLVAADTFVGPGVVTTLLVVDPANGGLIWERSLDQASLFDVAPDGSVAIATYSWEEPPLLLRLIGRDQYQTASLIWIDANGETILQTDPVRMPDSGSLVVTTSNDYACATVRELTCFDRAGTRYMPDASKVWDARFVENMLLLFTDTDVLRVYLP